MAGEPPRDLRERLVGVVRGIHAARYPEASVILAAGSLIRGEGTATSDLDLVVLFERLPVAYRESFRAGGYPVEAFVHDPETLEYFFTEKDRASSVPSLPRMVAEGVEVPGPNDLSRAAKARAEALLAAGPPPLDGGQEQRLRYAVSDLLDDLRAPRSPEEAAAIGAWLYEQLADYHLRRLGQWSARGKAIPRALRQVDAGLAARYAEAFHALFAAGDPAPVIGLAEALLAPAGGPLFEGYRADAPAAWRRHVDARAAIADHHHFATRDEFEAFLLELRDDASPTAQFEAAVDAVVSGDEATLDRLLRARPELIHARSRRGHRATLLLYVGANGVEGFRQETPKNAVRIARRLLDAGAEVDAAGTMYRGTTTLGLVATSVHPVRAGVQEALIDLLVEAGASLARAVAPDYTHGRVVNACLANGRGEGAQLVADRGAELDLEGAAGVGRLDVVKRFVDERGRLAPGASRDQLVRGCSWACQYGHREVVEFLLDGAIDSAESHGNATMLHHAALGGHADIVRLLLARGAPVDVQDDHFHATPLGWALHGSGHRLPGAPAEPYYDVVRQLVAAGAAVKADWLADAQVISDLQLLTALTK